MSKSHSMKKLILFAVLLMAVSACGKIGGGYYCQCTITHAAGSGIYTGNSSVRAKAEDDCQDKIAEVQSNNQYADCAVVENIN